jgi:hypothetical protein
MDITTPPDLDWEPIWFWKPVHHDAQELPEVEIMPPCDDMWRVPTGSMAPNRVYKCRNITFKIVQPGRLGRRKQWK